MFCVFFVFCILPYFLLILFHFFPFMVFTNLHHLFLLNICNFIGDYHVYMYIQIYIFKYIFDAQYQLLNFFLDLVNSFSNTTRWNVCNKIQILIKDSFSFHHLILNSSQFTCLRPALLYATRRARVQAH